MKGTALITLIMVAVVSVYGSYAVEQNLVAKRSLSFDPSVRAGSARLLLRKGPAGIRVGTATSISLLIDNGGGRIEQASALLSYDPAILHIDNVTSAGTICSSQLTQKIDPVLGSIQVSCSLASAATLAQVSPLVALTITPLQAGSTLITTQQKSRLTQGDRNLLQNLGDLSLVISP
ncbi:MAG: hypothetical protein WCO52_00705 [bacterium]